MKNILFILISYFILKIRSIILLPIPPRYMWGWGPGLSGYCGEMSTQSIGLYYGNYYSEEQVRYAGGNKEVLIDVNLHKACDKLKLTYIRWDNTNEKNPQGQNFLEWSQNFIEKNIPVIGGFYLQEKNGDRDYDHIMPIIGFETTNSKLSAIYHNDLYLNSSRILKVPSDIKTRSECSQNAPIEQPYTYCQPKTVAYGIAITGNVDINSETYPIQLDVGSWNEPDWGAEDNLNEEPILFSGLLSISNLTPLRSYSVLRYDSINALPSQNFFHANTHSYRYDFTPESTTFQLIDSHPFYSNSTIFYRCVVTR